MRDDELDAALHRLGLAPSDWPAVMLLPVVHVAWADGEVQEPERARVLELGMQVSANERVLLHWLTERPSDAQFALGRRVLVALASRHRGPGAQLTGDTLERVASWCEEVARAAGGLFNVAFTIDPAERKVMAQIAASLRRQSAKVADDLPTPEGGGFVEL